MKTSIAENQKRASIHLAIRYWEKNGKVCSGRHAV